MGTKARYIRAGMLTGALLVLALAGCGGSSPLTPASVRECIVDAGGEPWSLLPTTPKGAPEKFPHTYTIGPERGHIAVLFLSNPSEAEKLARGFDRIMEYDATVVHGGEMLVLLDTRIAKADEKVAFECVGAA